MRVHPWGLHAKKLCNFFDGENGFDEIIPGACAKGRRPF
jgi:hypothetical protein